MNIDLKQMLKELYQISGFRISVYDTEWREIASYPQQLSDFCSCIQKNLMPKRYVFIMTVLRSNPLSNPVNLIFTAVNSDYMKLSLLSIILECYPVT